MDRGVVIYRLSRDCSRDDGGNIFGDTINTASRIEAAGEAGKINVSAYTFALVKDEYLGEYRGKISAKGKGDLDMYFID